MWRRRGRRIFDAAMEVEETRTPILQTWYSLPPSKLDPCYSMDGSRIAHEWLYGEMSGITFGHHNGPWLRLHSLGLRLPTRTLSPLSRWAKVRSHFLAESWIEPTRSRKSCPTSCALHICLCSLWFVVHGCNQRLRVIKAAYTSHVTDICWLALLGLRNLQSFEVGGILAHWSGLADVHLDEWVSFERRAISLSLLANGLPDWLER